jgi:hypothetical protein
MIFAPPAGAGSAKVNVIVVDSPPITLGSDNSNAVKASELSDPSTLSEWVEARAPNPLEPVEGLWACKPHAAANTKVVSAANPAPRVLNRAGRLSMFVQNIHETSHSPRRFRKSLKVRELPTYPEGETF